MEVFEIFQVLGIEETKDEAAIKRAYREKLAVTNPEDNPEGFKRLRAAYEEACVYAKTTEEEMQEEEDNTPSGLWLKKVAEVYQNMDSRRDVKCWNRLFEEDIFLSLEEEENCRFKLLRFMLDNYKLPTDVWKLLDEKVQIIERASELREQFPGDFVNYLVNRCRQGEDIDFNQFEGAPDARYDLYIQYMERCWQAIREEQPEQVTEFLKNADDLEIYHPSMEYIRAWLWEQQGKKEDAVKWMLNLWNRYDRDIQVAFNTAELLWRNDHREESVEVYESIKENINEQHYMANVRLTQWYFEKEKYREAKKCAEEVLAIGGNNDEFQALLIKINEKLEKDFLQKYTEQKDYESGVELAFCYLQDEKYTQGISLAKELQEIVPKEKTAEYHGLLAKLYVESADFKDAVRMAELWEAALQEKLAGEQGEEKRKEREKDEDRIGQSLAIRLHSYHKLGLKDKTYLDKAIETVERMDSLKGDKPGINMKLEKAQIYIDMGEYEKCLEVTTELIEQHQVYVAYAIAQKAYKGMWDARGVVQSGYMCIRHFPDYAEAYERIAEVYLQLKYTEDLERLLGEAQQAGIKSDLLEAYRYQMKHAELSNAEIYAKMEEFEEQYQSNLDSGKQEYFEKGLPIITEYLYGYPGGYMFYKRGLFYMSAGKMDEAEADFYRVLSLEPGDPYSYEVLAKLYMRKGECERAAVCAKMAVLYYGEVYAGMYLTIARIYARLGQNELALQACEKMLELGGSDIERNQYAMWDYIHILAKNGKVKEAAEAISRIYDEPQKRYHELVDLYNSVGDMEKARLALIQWEKWLKENVKPVTKEQRADYYKIMAFHELIFGDGILATEYFEKQIKESATEPNPYSYINLLFACILSGNDEKGRFYAAETEKLVKQDAQEGRPERYHHMEKMILQREFLMKYYFASEEELEEIIKRQEQSFVCTNCAYQVCKEFEAVRILYMLRMGRLQEALDRLNKCLELQPYNDFLLAVKIQVNKGIKVSSDAVIRGMEQNGVSESSGIKESKGFLKGLSKIFSPKDKN